VLFNQYAFIPVNPALHPHVKSEAVDALESWLRGDHAKVLINGYTINGQQLFVFNAQPK
jgi:tungstate transport system substrate-binding protein